MARATALPTNPTNISIYENGVIKISSIPRVNFIKNKADEALEKLALIIDNINTPGNTKDMYGTPAKLSIFEPITVPKMKMYKAAEITGAARV
jgi:hypothetical protein